MVPTHYSMRKSSVVKCCFNSWTAAGGLGGVRGLTDGAVLSEERRTGVWRTGVPGTRAGSFRDE